MELLNLAFNKGPKKYNMMVEEIGYLRKPESQHRLFNKQTSILIASKTVA
jgi:hypothetical protein